jgi:hypothetical protein
MQDTKRKRETQDKDKKNLSLRAGGLLKRRLRFVTKGNPNNALVPELLVCSYTYCKGAHQSRCGRNRASRTKQVRHCATK